MVMKFGGLLFMDYLVYGPMCPDSLWCYINHLLA